MKREIRSQARTLRKQGKSIREIAEILEVSKGSVSTWVKDISLTAKQEHALKVKQHRWGAQNTGAQTNKKLAEQRRKQYQQEGREKAHEGELLHLMGCMLYWAEGAKRRNSIRFANSDPNMISLFVRFLRDSFKVTNDQINITIHCHNELEITRIEQYWLDLIDLPKTSLRKTQIKSGSSSRKNRLKNGICTVTVNNTQLVQQVFGAIQEYGGFDQPEWLY